METASKDVLFTIAMDLDLPSLLRWCASTARVQRDICKNDNVWRAKLLKDFPDGYPNYQAFNLNKSLRETYVFLYQLSLIKKLLNTEESLYDIFQRKEMLLAGKNLRKVPAFDLPNLETLSLSTNPLTQVPTFNLPNLRQLYLFSNSLTQVPNFHLPNLQLLHLGNNKLQNVPTFHLPNLKEFYLSDNQLTELPVFSLPKLEKFYLGYNRLKDVPDFNFPKLQIFSLVSNPLTEMAKIKLKNKYQNKMYL